MTLQKHVTSLLGQHDMASQTLLSLAAAARKNGRLPIAMSALHELQASLRSGRFLQWLFPMMTSGRQEVPKSSPPPA